MKKEKFTEHELNAIENAKIKLIKCIGMYDTEEAHAMADEALTDLLNCLCLNEVVDLYMKVDKWYA